MLPSTQKAAASSRPRARLRADELTLTAPLTASQKAAAKQRMLKQLVCSDAPEQALRYRGFRLIAGVDEVGRGALFGPVTAAACILPLRCAALMRAGLRDSKQLSREQRETLAHRIRRCAVAYAIADIDAATIDRINIYQATRLAMLTAVQALAIQPDHLIIDALLIDHATPQTKLFYGDALCLSIAAASVLAKVHRDALLGELEHVYPGYGLAQHKGYATPMHQRALQDLGPTPLHRHSFAPVCRAAEDPDDLLEARLSVADLFEDEPDFSPASVTEIEVA